jgi:hypothetical protein
MSPKKLSTPLSEPKTLTTRLDRTDDEKLEKMLLEARYRGVVPTTYSKSDFIRDAIVQQMERLAAQLQAADPSGEARQSKRPARHPA